MAKKKRPKAKTFRERATTEHPGKSLGFGRDKARKAHGLRPSHDREKKE